MIIVNVLISTNANTLEKETLYLPKEAIDEFLGEGFASNCYDAKVSFKCMPRFVNPDLINVLIELKDFIENFAEQFDDTTVEMLGAGTKFRELDEWSSLIALSVIAMVDEVYGITINGEDIRSSQTISDLFNRIMDKK